MASVFKKWGKSLLAGGAAGTLAGMVPGLRPYQAAISAGAGALANKNNRLAGAGAGLLGGGVGQTVAGGFGNWVKNKQPGGGFNAFTSGAGGGFRQYMNSVPGFKGFGTSEPVGRLAKFFTAPATKPMTAGSGRALNSSMLPDPNAETSSVLNKWTDKFGAMEQPKNYEGVITVDGFSETKPMGSTGIPGEVRMPAGRSLDIMSRFAPQAETTGAASVGPLRGVVSSGGIVPGRTAPSGNPMDFFKGPMGKAALGAGVGMMGDLFAPKVEAPDYTGLYNQQVEMLRSGGMNPEANKLVMDEARRVLTASPDAVPQAVLDAELRSMEEQYEQDKAIAVRQWQAANPGVDISNNSAFAKYMADMDMRHRQQIADYTAKRNFDYTQANTAARQNVMSMLAQMDSSQREQLLALASLPAQQIAYENDMSIAEAEEFKQLFSDLGTAIATV